MQYWKRIVTVAMALAMLLSLALPAAAESYETITLNQEKRVTVSSGNSVIFSFTPTQEGYYSFRSDDYSEGDPMTTVYDSDMYYVSSNDDGGEGLNFDVSWYAYAGRTYYLEARGYGSYTAQVVRLVPPTALELDRTSHTGYADPNNSNALNYSFLPENAYPEYVTFSSSNEQVVSVDYYNGYYRMLSPGTAVITATSESGLTASCTVTVMEPQTVVCDQVVKVNEDEDSCVLRFAPQASGWYGFYSTGNQLDTWGYIQGEEGNQLAYNDDNGQDNNFLAKAWLEAGSTYTLIGYWSNYGSGRSAQLQITALSAAQSLDIETVAVSMYVPRQCSASYTFNPLLSIPEAVTWTSSDDKVATVDEDGTVTAVGGGTAVITATSESGFSDSYTVTCKVAPQVTCDDVMELVYEDGEQMFKFIPETSGWYGFYSSNPVGGCDPRGYIRDTHFNQIASSYDNGIDENFLAKAYLEAGETYYLDAGYSSMGSDDHYEARIAPLTPATGLTLSCEAVTKQIGTGMTLNAYMMPLLSIDEAVTWSSSNEAVVTVSDYGRISCLAVGTAVITASSENGLQASCTVTVTTIPNIALNQVVAMDASVGAYRHRFTAPQTGWYSFGSTDCTMDPCAALYDELGNELASSDDDGEGRNFRIFHYMQAGEICLLESRPLSDGVVEGSYNIQVVIPPEATAVELSRTNRSGFVGDTGWLDATLVPSDARPQEITWTSSNEAVVTVDNYGNLDYIGVGTATVTATTEAGLSASCAVTVKDVRNISLGDSVTLDAKEGNQRFLFVPAVTGTYRFYSTGSSVNPWCDIYCGSYYVDIGDVDSSQNFSVYPYLEAGLTYELYVYVSEDETEDYTVHLEKAVEPTGVQLSHTAISGEPGDSIQLTASLVPGNAAPVVLNWSTSNESVASIGYDNRIDLKSEGTAVITVTSAAGHSATCQVTSAYKTPIPIQCDRPATVTAADGTSWFSFVPQTSGWYRFFSKSTGADPYGAICDADRNSLASSDDYDGTDFSASYELTAGQTYYLRVKFYGSDASDSCTVEVEKMSQATGIVLSSTQIMGYEGDYRYLYAELTPEFAIPENITWTSSNKNVVTVDEYGELFLKKAGTAVITVTTTRGLTASCTVTVNSIPTISLNQPQTLDASHGYYKYKFTPQSSGWYGFYTTGDADTYGYLSDEDGYWYGENDDGGEDNNYMLRCELEAGKTYFLTSSYYDEYTEGTSTLRVVTLTKPTGIQLNFDQLTAYPDSYIYSGYSFQPLTSYYESVTWSSSNTNVVTVDEYGDIYTVAPGTARVTVTSESGFTDSMTVVVAAPPADADDYGRCGPNLLWQFRGNVLTITGSGEMYNEPWFPDGFTQVQLPEGLTSIGAYAFYGEVLQGIVIPSSVEWIAYGAFTNCTIPSIRFLGHAPDISDDAFGNLTTTAYYPQNDPTWTAAVRQNYGGNVTWVAYDPATMVGAAVSGSVTTGATGTTTVELLLNGAVAYTATVSGKTGSYSFSNVLPGNYTLRVSKLNHVTREYTLTVGSWDVTQPVQIKLIGDVNGDGRVNVGDVARIYAHAKKTAFLTDPYDLLCANVNGDSRINVGDAARVYAHAKKTSLLF